MSEVGDDDPEDLYERETISNVVFPRKLVRKFIQLYKENPCLWDRNNPDFKYKLKRHEAITRLTELVQQHDPSATRVHVMRKIESLRACVRREHKRVRDSRRNANSPDEIFKPNLWYYELFSFVFNDANNVFYDKYKRPKHVEILPTMDSDVDEAPEEDDLQIDTSGMESYHVDYGLASSMVEVANSSKRLPEYDDDMNKLGKRHCTEVDDEYDAIGVNVAAKLRNLPQNVRILAEKLINDVLFQAQLNGLSPSTVISTPDPFKQDST